MSEEVHQGGWGPAAGSRWQTLMATGADRLQTLAHLAAPPQSRGSFGLSPGHCTQLAGSCRGLGAPHPRVLCPSARSHSPWLLQPGPPHMCLLQEAFHHGAPYIWITLVTCHRMVRAPRGPWSTLESSDHCGYNRTRK